MSNVFSLLVYDAFTSGATGRIFEWPVAPMLTVGAGLGPPGGLLPLGGGQEVLGGVRNKGEKWS